MAGINQMMRVARTQVPSPEIVMPFANSDAMMREARVETMPMPPAANAQISVAEHPPRVAGWAGSQN